MMRVSPTILPNSPINLPEKPRRDLKKKYKNIFTYNTKINK
jgi:hypothetical protein